MISITIYPVFKKIRNLRPTLIRLASIPRVKRIPNSHLLSERLCNVVSYLRTQLRLSRKWSSQLRSKPKPRQLRAVGKIAILQTALEAPAQNERAQTRRTVESDQAPNLQDQPQIRRLSS